MLSVNDFYTELVTRYNECDFSFIPISQLGLSEREYFRLFMPDAKTAIVIFHPVKKLIDWTWNCPDGKIESERCNIDDKSNEICRYIQEKFISANFNTEMVPYPGESGLQFRYVALSSGYGEIGKNAFYLHPVFGARVHLRVMASEIISGLLCSIRIKTNRVCTNCGECIRNCPANAFENGFDGLKCREFRRKRGEYIPVGEKGVLRYCKKCILVCPAGRE